MIDGPHFREPEPQPWYKRVGEVVSGLITGIIMALASRPYLKTPTPSPTEPEEEDQTLEEHLQGFDLSLTARVPPGALARARRIGERLKNKGFEGKRLRRRMAEELRSDPDYKMSPTVIIFIVRLVLLMMSNPWVTLRRKVDMGQMPVFGSQAPDENSRETTWSAWYAENHAGKDAIAEYRLPDGSRVDVLDNEFAIEVERAHKWEEAIGQSAFYSLMTGKEAKIVLLCSGADGEDEDILRCMLVASHWGIPVEIINTKKALVQ